MVVKEGQNLWYTRVTFQWSGGGGGNCADCVNWTRGGMEVLGALYTESAPKTPLISVPAVLERNLASLVVDVDLQMELFPADA